MAMDRAAAEDMLALAVGATPQGNPDGVVSAADVRAADVLLDALAAALPDSVGHLKHADHLEARGVIAAHLAHVRSAGYLQGEADGRRRAGALVREKLREEGL